MVCNLSLQVNRKKNSKIPKGQTEIFKSEDRQDHGQQNRNERQTVGTTLH